MARLTNQDLHSEIKLVKQDVCHIKDNQVKMQDDLTMIKKQLLQYYVIEVKGILAVCKEPLGKIWIH